MYDEAMQAQKQSYRDNMSPCMGCPIYQLPELHPVTLLAVKIHGLLEGGPVGREMYDLESFPITDDQYHGLFVPMMHEWKDIVRIEGKKAAARAKKEAERESQS